MDAMDTTNTVVQVLTTVAFLIGACGNIAALWILYRTAKRRNRKHLLMLRCLAMNDLVAQVGMLLLIHLKRYNLLPDIWSCVGFVLLRAFGLGSGCVAFVMALERWLALTRPFMYHQLVTYQMLKRFLFCLWLSAVFLTYLPLFGFGLYYNQDGVPQHGATLCICIALCNSSVVWELSRIRSQGKILVRRVSRSIISNRVGCSRYQTPEEVAFAKLMAIVCVIFVACWAPQVISVPIAQFFPKASSTRTFTKIADTLLCVYFTLDPFVYVLQNYMEGRFIWPCCSLRRSMSSLPTTTTTVGTPTSVLLNPPSYTDPPPI
ncbi:hypothetical protein NQ318_001721 [Aromia moschata]|uniref:G-protein coupled receptors family 1 profile domain-containing protein n=1 Tax=Aromia moschata TaxID=1265417 RepID=A0AAV8XSB5_9CUCU|nr:hypothetical protein NQ318_001721 [Aromia moschata]